jgi:DNA-binding NtrC family response regulator
MHRTQEVTQIFEHLAHCYASVRCPAQILVVDRVNGPANILVDTLSLVLDREVSVTSVEEHTDALLALDCCAFDLVVVGLEAGDSMQLTLLPHLHVQNPNIPVMVVGRNLPRLYKQYARHYGAREVLNMPDRAADLKQLIECVSQQYLQAA